jgi:hypothetical protein
VLAAVVVAADACRVAYASRDVVARDPAPVASHALGRSLRYVSVDFDAGTWEAT